jgi:hypothetical protein
MPSLVIDALENWGLQRRGIANRGKLPMKSIRFLDCWKNQQFTRRFNP